MNGLLEVRFALCGVCLSVCLSVHLSVCQTFADCYCSAAVVFTPHAVLKSKYVLMCMYQQLAYDSRDGYQWQCGVLLLWSKPLTLSKISDLLLLMDVLRT